MPFSRTVVGMRTTVSALSLALGVLSLAPAAMAQNDPINAVVNTAANAANGVLGNSPSSPTTARTPSSRTPSTRPPALPSVARPLPRNAPRQVLTLTADGYMNLPLETFLSVRRVQPPPFDWTANGCSFGEISGPFRESFNRACNRHEFGYRNYGGRGLALDRTEARRTRVDDRLRDDLNGICRHDHAGLTETPCLAAAQAVYAAARAAGSNWFMTGNGRPPSIPTPSVPGINNGQTNGPIPGVPIPGLGNPPTHTNTFPIPVPGVNGGQLPIPGLQQ